MGYLPMANIQYDDFEKMKEVFSKHMMAENSNIKSDILF